MSGHPLAYLDSAATTQRPAAVLAALLEYYRHDNSLLNRFGVSAASPASCYLYTHMADLDRRAAALRGLTYSHGKEPR